MGPTWTRGEAEKADDRQVEHLESRTLDGWPGVVLRKASQQAFISSGLKWPGAVSSWIIWTVESSSSAHCCVCLHVHIGCTVFRHHTGSRASSSNLPHEPSAPSMQHVCFVTPRSRFTVTRHRIMSTLVQYAPTSNHPHSASCLLVLCSRSGGVYLRRCRMSRLVRHAVSTLVT